MSAASGKVSGKVSGKYGVEAFTVDEQMRINFTKQLLKLRDDSVKEVVFPSTLTNIERKFLHKLSEELGLKSKSSGAGNDRKITVTKPKEGAEGRGSGPANVQLNHKVVDALQSTFANYPIPSRSELQVALEDHLHLNNDVFVKPASAVSEAESIRSAYLRAQQEREKKGSFKTLQQKRATLPAYHHRLAVCSLIKEKQIVLVSGETGCGKTTQVPQFLLDDPEIGPTCRIVVTQPRRLSAISVAERIAAERNERIGSTIGYNIRLESEKSRSTQVLFVTPGVLLRKLQTDPTLEEFTHIIIDEAHERDRFTEFLMIILKFVCAQRSDLKLILMSATLQTTKLSSYFGGVPQIHMGGSVFPVQEFFLEHVLRFTDYLTSQPGGFGSGGGGGRNSSALSAYLRRSQEYFCSICRGGGPFKSPEELGTHCALCTGEQQTTTTSFSSNSSAHSQGQVATKSAGGTSFHRGGNRHSSAEELVRMLSAAVASESEAQYAGGASAKGGGGISASSALQGARAAGGGGPQQQTAGKKEKEGEQGKEEQEDGEKGPEGEEEPDEPASPDDDDDDDNPAVSSGARAVSSVEVDNEGANTADDTGDGSDSLLKQYQYSFDDSQVDYDLILSLLHYIFKSEFCKEGSVLVFMPGWDDISRMHRILSTTREFMDTTKFKLIQLHSGIPRKAQDAVFEQLQPGEHKIILSTNIAETSITIDDVAVVIDAGRVKEKMYDPHIKLAYLKSNWISQASARQRKGRAGRTRAGVCFHLFSKRRHSSLPEFQDSELLRMPLEELVLQAKQLGVAPGHGDAPDSVQSFLSRALDPPHILSVSNAISLLQSISCLDEFEQVTPIGKAISRLPLDPRIGRIILLACICGCGPAVLSTSAAMAYRDPFIMPANDQQRAQSSAAKAHLTQGFPSDQVALLKALDGFNVMFTRFNIQRANQFCDENFLSRSTMYYLRDLIQQFTSTLREVGISPAQAYSQRNNGSMQLLTSIIGIGLYPDVGVRQNGATAFLTEKGRKARIHPSSVNSRSAAYKGPSKEEIQIIGYQDLVSNAVSNGPPGSANLMMLNTTPVSVFALLLTCGAIREVAADDELGGGADEGSDEEEDDRAPTTASDPNIVVVEVDNWLRLKLNRSVLGLIRSSRATLSIAMELFLANPEGALPTNIAKGVDAIVQALTLEQSSVSDGLLRSAKDEASSRASSSNRGGNNNNNSWSSNRPPPARPGTGTGYAGKR